jgi:SAM-dependent methyltransferase
MQVYTQEDDLIERWQWNDPALRNLSDVVLGLLRGERGRVLDLGCGTGRLAADLAAAGFVVDGIDVDERVIAIGQRIMVRRDLNVKLYAGDVSDPRQPVTAGGYDIVVCTEVLEHVAAWRELLTRGGELLRPGGLLVISVPRDPSQFSVLDSYAGHLRRFRDEELIAELRGGYEQLVVRYLGWPSMRGIVWGYTQWLALRGRSHAKQSQTLWRKPDRPQQLATALFYRLLKFDNLCAWLPFGTTLVVRARKCHRPALYSRSTNQHV